MLVFLRNFDNILADTKVCDARISASCLKSGKSHDDGNRIKQVGSLKHTNASSQIQGTEDPNGEIWVNLADDLDSVARSEVGFLH